MGTDLVPAVPARPRRQSIEITEANLALWQRQADILSATDFVPSGYAGKPGNIIAAAMLGADLGWSLMHSLQNIHSWTTTVNEKVRDPDTGREGWVSREQPTTAISSPAKLSLLIEAGHSHEIMAHDARHVILRGRRCDRTTLFAVELTIGDEDLAHLVGRKMWQQHPKRMLWWRAVSELVAVMCPEVVMGVTANPEDAPSSSPEPMPAPVGLDVLERVPTNAIEAGAPAITVVESEAPADGGAFPLQPSAGVAPHLDEMLDDVAPRTRGEAKTAVLAAVDGDTVLAADCWAEMTSRLPWAAYDDPGAWARAWLSTRRRTDAARPHGDDPTPQAEIVPAEAADAPQCEYRGRDGRRCTRDAHDSTSHRLEPKADANSGGAGPADPTPPDTPPDGGEGQAMIPDGQAPAPSETSGGAVEHAPHSSSTAPPEPADWEGEWDDGPPPGAEPARGPSGKLL